jgi:predicted enzyme related to lactoylglutathione lyase
MNLRSLRIITGDIKRLVQFFEKAINLPATWYTEDFAEIVTSNGTLALGSQRTMNLFGEWTAQPGSNNRVIIEFLVNNVDDDYERIIALTNDIIQKPTTMPWGNRSLLFRDPDGNLINFFTPVTPGAIKKFS